MKKRWLFGLLAVAAIMGTVLTTGRPSEPVTVDAVTLSARQVEQTVTCLGAVESGKQTGVFAPITCVIRRVEVKQGQRVKKGDVLAVIDRDATREKMEDPAQLMVLAALSEELTAPGDGIVMAVKAIAGKTLESGNPCVVLAMNSDLQVRIAIRERDLRVLKTGMPVRITGDGFQKDVYEGTLTEIASATRSDSGSGAVVEGVVTFKAEQMDASLRLGLSAKAAVVTAVKEDALLLPYETVLTEDEQSYVYVLQDGVASRRNIRISAQTGEGVLVADEDLLGAQVVAQPDRIDRDGVAVSVREESR